jgi:hypothetical protein
VANIVLVLAAVTAGLAYFHYVYGPTKWLESNERKRRKACGASTTEFHDLLLEPFFSPEQQANAVRLHGAAVVHTILTEQTAHTLREYMLERNENARQHDVMEAHHRIHILPSPKDPAVKQALKEIATHATLRPLLKSILGPSPSLLSLYGITTTYGSVDQRWHLHTGLSHSNYPRHFVAEYTLRMYLFCTDLICSKQKSHYGPIY